MLLWSIGVAAVIRARGKVRAVSEQARGAGWVSPFIVMADQDPLSFETPCSSRLVLMHYWK